MNAVVFSAIIEQLEALGYCAQRSETVVWGWRHAVDRGLRAGPLIAASVVTKRQEVRISITAGGEIAEVSDVLDAWHASQAAHLGFGKLPKKHSFACAGLPRSYLGWNRQTERDLCQGIERAASEWDRFRIDDVVSTISDFLGVESAVHQRYTNVLGIEDQLIIAVILRAWNIAVLPGGPELANIFERRFGAPPVRLLAFADWWTNQEGSRGPK